MKILVIAPHMDDEILGVGGTIVKHIKQGDIVTVCIVANRAYQHKYNKSLIESEREATHQAKKILGYQNLVFLDLKDEQLDAALINIIIPLEKIYTKIKPDIVYTCHGGDSNQDHQATFSATVVVCRSVGVHRPSRILCYETPSSTDQSPPLPNYQFAPNLYVEIAPEELEKKIEAMKCYKLESRTFPHPRSSKGLNILAEKRGIEIGIELAEAFMVIREIWT